MRLALSVGCFWAAFAPLGMASDTVATPTTETPKETGWPVKGPWGLGVRYEVMANDVKFIATLPLHWSLQILVDGNQDGRWGYGPDDPNNKSQPTDDTSYSANDSNGYQLCAQYVWSSGSKSPDAPRELSNCGAFPSEAHVVAAEPNDNKFVTATYSIPNKELFGNRPSAHVALIIWNTKVNKEYVSLSNPLIIARPAP